MLKKVDYFNSFVLLCGYGTIYVWFVKPSHLFTERIGSRTLSGLFLIFDMFKVIV